MSYLLDTYWRAGDTNWNDALARLLLDVPDTDYDIPPDTHSGRDNVRPAFGARIVTSARVYQFSEFLAPRRKLFTIEAPSRNGSVIESASGTAFVIEAGWSFKTFKGLLFNGCAVEFQAQARGQYLFDSCSWDHSPNYGIYSPGEGVLGVSIVRGYFNRCRGAIGVLGKASDLWFIDEQTFVIRSAGTNPAMRFNTSGVLCRAKFENRSDLTVPAYVQIAPGVGYGGGHVTLEGCRFGGEMGSGLGPPPAMVLLGGDKEEAGTMSGVRITGCDFNFNQGNTELRYDGIVCNKSANLSQFSGNKFLGGIKSAVRYSNSAGLFTINNMRDNHWSASNIIDSAKGIAPVSAVRVDGIYSKLDMASPFKVLP